MGIDFTEYDRITDTLMWLTDNITLGFTVGLSRKGKNGERTFYHYESQYASDKFGSPLRSIKRQLSYAFTLDCKDDFTAGMMFRPQDVELLIRIIDQKVLPWFFGNDKDNAFKIVSGKYILKDFTPATFIQTYSTGNRWMSFQPEVYSDQYTELESMAIRIELSSGITFILPLDKFMGFYNIISRTDMYSVACSLCNYVKTGPYGINTFSNQGLGAVPNGNNSTIDDAWKNRGFKKNSFLDNSDSK